MARVIFALAVALAGCAEAHCAQAASDDASPPDAGRAPRDAGVDAECGRTGRAMIGPIVSGDSLDVIRSCSDGRLSVEVTAFRTDGSVAARIVHACDESDYADLGSLPAGVYRVAVRAVDQFVGSGGTLLRHRWCLPPGDPNRRWCHPIELDVRPCGLAIAPVRLTCDPDVSSGCL